MFGICQTPYKNLTYEMNRILEYRVFDLLKDPENEKFLDKVKKENPDEYNRFLNLVGNKGLEVAKQKYQIYDPEYKKQKEAEEKAEKLFWKIISWRCNYWWD